MANGETRSGTVTLLPAAAVVVGSMVGTGVFTSLGFQVVGIQSGFVLVLLWGLGGVFALCGALCYGELAAALPRSGGEYHFLSRIYHPAAGFLAGWISVTVGFAAPVALVAMAFAAYLSKIVAVPEIVLSGGLVAVVTAVHLCHIEVGSRFQSIFTALKVLLIAVLIGAAFLVGQPQGVRFHPAEGDLGLFFSTPFAVSLVFVMYAYSGWNATTYVVSEVKNPRKTVPQALFFGTLLVTILYVGLNAAFLYSTPMSEMVEASEDGGVQGKREVGLVAARHIFGHEGGNLMALLICFGLISALSAMTWSGPRVAQMMGQDYRALRWLAVTSARGIPWVAVLWQTAIVYLLLVLSDFEATLVYIGLLLNLFSFLTVLGLFWLRIREPALERPVKAWGYPLTPLLFLGVSLWMMIYVSIEKPEEWVWGIATLGVGAGLYGLARVRGVENRQTL